MVTFARIKSKFRSQITDSNMEYLMFGAIEGPEQLTREMAGDILDRFAIMDGKERYIQLKPLK